MHYFYFTTHCYHCISPNLRSCAWVAGDLGVLAYLQGEVVSRVPCHRNGMCVRVLGLQLSPYIYCLDTINYTIEIKIIHIFKVGS